MKVSELIDKLTVLKEQSGDLEVAYTDGEWGNMDIDSVEVRKNALYSKTNDLWFDAIVME